MSLPFRKLQRFQVTFCLLALLLAGCGNRSTLGKTSATVVVVEAAFPGANCKVVADTVAAPIEQQVDGVANSLHLTSRCTNDGRYTLTVTFKPGTDINAALVAVQNRVTLALPVLPDTAQRQGVTIKKKAPLLMLVNLTSPKGRFDTLHMSNYAKINLQDELVRIADVGEVVGFGRSVVDFRVSLDPDKLAARKLASADVMAALADQNVQVVAGKPGQLREPHFQLELRGRFSEAEEFANIIVKTDGKGAIVRLQDVGRIDSTATSNYVSLNGNPGVCLGIYPIRAARELGPAVQNRLTQLRTRLPDGLRLELAFDFSVNLDAPSGPKTPEYLLVDLHLPHAASRERTIEVLKQCEKLLRKVPGVQDVLAQTENPFDFVRDQPCILVRLAPAGRKISLREITSTIRTELNKVSDAGACLRDLTRPGSFPRFNYPVDLAISGPALEKTQLLADKLAAALTKSKKLTDVSANQDIGSRPKGVYLQIDRAKAETQGVSLADIFSTLQVYLGSVLVNDFARFGKTLQVVVPEDGGKNKNIEDLLRLQVKNKNGEMKMLKAMISTRPIDFPAAINRLDLRPHVQVTANPAADVSLAEARTLCQGLFDELRRELRLSAEYRLIWAQES